MIEVIPAILTDSSLRFKELVRRMEPYTNRTHIDVSDGSFVSSYTVKGYTEIKEMDSTGSPQVESAVRFDIHLMVKKPQEQAKEWFYTHADRFIVHAESEVDFAAIIKDIKDHKRKVGLALNPETNSDTIEEYLPDVDFVQFMAVNPGAQGSPFVGEVVEKIKNFHERHPDMVIMADGGITPETAPLLVKAGVSQLVSGSYIVKSKSIEEAIEELRNSIM